ncbi:MAG: chromosomal replication initiator protein DnaA [Anaerovoracaceae bacterium]
MNDLQEKWQQTLELLEPEVTPVSYKTWFKPLVPQKVDDTQNILYVECQDEYMIEIISNRYTHLLEGMIKMIFRKPYKLKIVFTEKEEEKEEEIIPLSTSSSITPDFENEYIFNPRYNFDNFVVGKNNEYAHAVALAVAENPASLYNPLFLYGGSGLGKTHLMHAIGHHILLMNKNSKALYVSSEMFTNEFISALKEKKMAAFKKKYREIDVLLIDDVQFIEGKDAMQEEFFHTFNTLYDNNKQIIISSDRPPKDLINLDERLRSRFGWNIVADVKTPDYETRMAILEKKAEQEKLVIDENVRAVLGIIAEKIKFNVRELEGAFTRIISFSRLLSKPITPTFAKEILKDIVSNTEVNVGTDSIKRTVCRYFDISVTDIESKKKTRALAYPRQIAMYLCRELTDNSLPKIGESFGGRDHTTVLHAYEKISKELKDNDNTKEIIDTLYQQLKP